MSFIPWLSKDLGHSYAGEKTPRLAASGEGTKDSTCHHPLRHLWGWVSEGPRPTNQRTGTEELALLLSGSMKLKA